MLTPEDNYLYSWMGKRLTNDPRLTDVELACIDKATRPNIYLDGILVNGRVRWCVTGNPGAIDLYDKPEGKFVVDETTGRARHVIRIGRVEVIPSKRSAVQLATPPQRGWPLRCLCRLARLFIRRPQSLPNE